MTILSTGLNAVVQKTALVALLALGLAATGTTTASAVTCPNPSPGATVTISTPGTCGTYGNNDINVNSPPFSGYTLIDATGTSGGTANGALTGISTGQPGGTSGSFTVAVPGNLAYTSFLMLFRVGTGDPRPDWITFLLPAINGTWTWSLNSGNNYLTQVAIYGAVAAVPVPAGVALLGTGMGLLGLLGWRRKRPAATAAA